MESNKQFKARMTKEARKNPQFGYCAKLKVPRRGGYTTIQLVRDDGSGNWLAIIFGTYLKIKVKNEDFIVYPYPNCGG